MPSDHDFALLSARVAVLEKMINVSDGKLNLSADGAKIQLSKFGIRIDCGDLEIHASNRVTIKGDGIVTIKGSTVNVN